METSFELAGSDTAQHRQLASERGDGSGETVDLPLLALLDLVHRDSKQFWGVTVRSLGFSKAFVMLCKSQQAHAFSLTAPHPFKGRRRKEQNRYRSRTGAKAKWRGTERSRYGSNARCTRDFNEEGATGHHRGGGVRTTYLPRTRNVSRAPPWTEEIRK